MASFNRVVLVGNLTKDIELRHTKTGTAVTDVSLAVNERVKKNEQWVDEAHFFDITLWGRLAEIAAEYLSKGSSVLIEGRLKHDRWEQDGQKRSKVGIVGEKMQMLGSKGGMEEEVAQVQAATHRPLVQIPIRPPIINNQNKQHLHRRMKFLSKETPGVACEIQSNQHTNNQFVQVQPWQLKLKNAQRNSLDFPVEKTVASSYC